MAGNIDWNAIAAKVIASYKLTSRWEWDGSTTTTPAPNPARTLAPSSKTIGTGADSLVLKISEDAWKGDAQYTIKVDGKQIGGTLTAAADHGTASDTLTVKGDWRPGAHKVEVTFLNDAWGGTAATDRNLFVDSASYNGKAVAGSALSLTTTGTKAFTFTEAGTTPPPPPPPQDGFKVVFSNHFSAGYKASHWGNPFDGGRYWNNGFEWSNDDVKVENGVLKVSVHKHSDGHWTAGGFISFKADKTITYGTVEFDARLPEAQGTMTAILMWPKSDRWPVDGEIDIVETPGHDVMHTTHWQGSGGGQHLYDAKRGQFYDETQWNHYKMTWLPGDLTVQVNGKVVAHWTGADAVPDGPWASVPWGMSGPRLMHGWAVGRMARPPAPSPMRSTTW